ncbi:DMT family transporter [Ferrimicrobium sp.]|uniref:DMT family transporter n=1 Tax=Ferrimicrobium sp. TaxID=2926050 RepID=UPI002606658E|nr:DMT family transporter [Ferrimicrobium sp.]
MTGMPRRWPPGFPWLASFVLLGAIWGCSFWWIKLGLGAVAPIDVTAIRLVIGAFTLLVILAITHGTLPRSIRVWVHLCVLAIFLNSIPFTLFAYGETHVSAVLAGIINSLTPLATIAMSLAIFGQRRPKPEVILGIAVGLVGVLVVTGIWDGLGHNQLLGIGACLLAVASYGIAFPYARRYLSATEYGPVSLATGQVLCGALQTLPFALVFGHLYLQRPLHIVVAAIAGLLSLGVFSTGIAYVLNFHVLESASATVASTVTYLTPFFAVVAGILFLGEPFLWREPLGGLVILVGAALAQGRLRLPEPETQSTMLSCLPRIGRPPSEPIETDETL